MKALRRLALLLTLALAGAAAHAAPEGRLYAPGSFDRLEIDGSADIRLVQGDRDQVFVPGDEQIQQGLEIHLVGSRLLISPSGSWKFWSSRRPVIEVQMRQPTQLILSGSSDLHAPGPIKSDQLTITISGSGLVRFDELNVTRLRFDISGSGDGRLAGEAEELQLNVSGKGKVLAEQLRTRTAAVSIGGVGNASLWVTDALRVAVSGIGQVEYWGQPTLKRSLSGVGTLNSRGDKPPR